MCVKKLAEHGACEPNAIVERVLLQADIGGTEVEWKNEASTKFRSLFTNLRPLNDHFVLQIQLDCSPLFVGLITSNDYEVLLNTAVTRGCELLKCAKEAGIASVELETAMSLSHLNTEKN
ncbi:hypothetical protein M3Y99_00096600 [Aphelenchoides fujianensis]|nr:hypothetical protein M3Y99_00096600 [Aphelenchoides fujianensis]